MNLLEALVVLYNHKYKTKSASFRIHHYGAERVTTITKGWSKQKKQWVYALHQTHCPALAYTEDTIISALADISGIRLHFNKCDFNVSDIEIHDYTD